MTHLLLTFPVGSRQDLQSRRLQGAVTDRPGWRLGHGSTNVPLTAQLYTSCTRETCRFGIHMCAYASVAYWDTLEGGEWTWHVVDSRRGAHNGIHRIDETAHTDPGTAVAAAETGLAEFLARDTTGGA